MREIVIVGAGLNVSGYIGVHFPNFCWHVWWNLSKYIMSWGATHDRLAKWQMLETNTRVISSATLFRLDWCVFWRNTNFLNEVGAKYNYNNTKYFT